MVNPQHFRRLCFAVCLACCLTGCSMLPPKLPDWMSMHDEAENLNTKEPRKIVALWSDNVYYEAGSVPVRGLGGRIYFYDEEQNAVPVDGHLVVYAFEDDDQADAQDRQPVKKFVFTPEQLVKHYSASEFGPSYSFWLPWDAVGNETAQISVLPVFADAGGRVVMGQHARHRLPGASAAEELPAVEEHADEDALFSQQERAQMKTRIQSIPLHRGLAAGMSAARLAEEDRPEVTVIDDRVRRTAYSDGQSDAAGSRAQARTTSSNVATNGSEPVSEELEHSSTADATRTHESLIDDDSQDRDASGLRSTTIHVPPATRRRLQRLRIRPTRTSTTESWRSRRIPGITPEPSS